MRVVHSSVPVACISHQPAHRVEERASCRRLVGGRKLRLQPTVPIDAGFRPVRIEVAEDVPRHHDVGQSQVESRRIIGVVNRSHCSA